MNPMKNAEGYPDFTAGISIRDVGKEEQKVVAANSKLIMAFRTCADLAGFEIVGRITLKHKASGRIFR